MKQDLELVELKTTEFELQSLVNESGKEQLAQCVRMLSMYVALYKKSFGELPPSCFEKILNSSVLDVESAKIFENGMLEAITILNMVLQAQAQHDHRQYAGITIN